ncbi:MAG TPA: hypothetical protein VKX25_13285 [Bryobacteraceae bacterium]|jgi:hypothetical protein|nr:hypothetical protein [Bryobacteraceae bacterium]
MLISLVTLLAFQTLAPLKAEEIMSKVATNQDREQRARNEFVYEQKMHRTYRGKDGRLLREEFWTYAMTPSSKGTERKLVSVRGRYWHKGKYIPFEGEPVPKNGAVEITFDDDNETNTRDGIDSDLFPLTTAEQKKYRFSLLGEGTAQGRSVYRIGFEPIDPSDLGWKGEATIDKEELQPIVIYTRLARKLPAAVRIMFGTDIHGLGYSIRYKRVDKDIWFPEAFGTEFDLRALFLLNRTVTESAENVNFRRATVESTIGYGGSDPVK